MTPPPRPPVSESLAVMASPPPSKSSGKHPRDHRCGGAFVRRARVALRGGLLSEAGCSPWRVALRGGVLSEAGCSGWRVAHSPTGRMLSEAGFGAVRPVGALERGKGTSGPSAGCRSRLRAYEATRSAGTPPLATPPSASSTSYTLTEVAKGRSGATLVEDQQWRVNRPKAWQ